NRIPSCLERLIQFRQRQTASPAIPDDTPDVFQQLGNVLIVCRPEMRPCRYPAAASFRMAKFQQVDKQIAAPVPYKTPYSPRLIAVGLHKSPPVLAGAFGSDPFYFLEDLIGNLVHLLFDCLGYIFGILPDRFGNFSGQLVNRYISHPPPPFRR